MVYLIYNFFPLYRSCRLFYHLIQMCRSERVRNCKSRKPNRLGALWVGFMCDATRNHTIHQPYLLTATFNMTQPWYVSVFFFFFIIHFRSYENRNETKTMYGCAGYEYSAWINMSLRIRWMIHVTDSLNYFWKTGQCLKGGYKSEE